MCYFKVEEESPTETVLRIEFERMYCMWKTSGAQAFSTGMLWKPITKATIRCYFRVLSCLGLMLERTCVLPEQTGTSAVCSTL